MKKKLSLFVLCLITTFVYSQQSTLSKNINYRAKELSHNLNKTGDSLILKGERTIHYVQIFNSDFDRKVRIGDSIAKIAINDIPVGRYIVEAQLSDKLIVLTLNRNKSFKNTNSLANKENSVINASFNQISGNKGKSNNTKRLTKKPKAKAHNSYWIVYHIDNGYGSRKIKRMGDQKLVDKMIEQNRIDVQTSKGKSNKLNIWEVYDTTKFMRYKRINPDYAVSANTDSFNSIPYYSSIKASNNK